MKPRTQKLLVFVLSSSMMLSGCYWPMGRRGGGWGHHRWSSTAFDGNSKPSMPGAPAAAGMPETHKVS